MQKILISLCVSFCFLTVQANEIEIRYHIPGSTKAEMIWGLNNWDTTKVKPAGTIVIDHVMHSPMIKDGDYFILKLNLPDSASIDYMFEFLQSGGPFNLEFHYWDYNKKLDSKFYHTSVKGNMILNVSPDFTTTKPYREIKLIKYSKLFLGIFCVIALLIALYKKIILKSNTQSFQPFHLLISIFIALSLILTGVRTFITDTAIQFLITPVQTIPIILKTAAHDFIYCLVLTLFFGSIMLLKKNWQTISLWLFGILAIISIIICMLNIKVTGLLGRPFNYQWLYYSDFLNSTDAKRAVGNNFDTNSIIAYALMCASIIPLTWIFYQLIIKKTILPITMLSICILIGIFSKPDPNIEKGRLENPISYFLSSIYQQNGLSALSNSKGNGSKDFGNRNSNVILPKYAAKFNQTAIKNVIIFVLESTPAEYVTPFNKKYNATPFMDSIKLSAAFFDAFYAHAPATNQSMVSIMCGMYPYLSYKSITVEKPDIKWPSISSELEKSGFKTSFFNSGDNRFHGAETFMQYRKIKDAYDFRSNICNSVTFADKRYVDKNLDGISDSCLSVNFFNWLQKNESDPFFSLMWTYQTHYPYFFTGTKKDFGTNNELLEKYLNALKQADETLKQLVEGLKRRNLFDSTLIVVLGDHGEAFGRHGQTAHAGGIFEENIHIPLMLINPQLFNGEHLNVVGGISDLAPTIFTILKKPIPTIWQGENLFTINRRKKVFFFSPYSDLLFGYREGKYKLIYNASNDEYALYNLEIDPTERINIDDKNKALVDEGKNSLQDWIQYQTDFVKPYLK